MLARPRRLSSFLKIFSKTDKSTEAEFHVEPSWKGETKLYKHGSGHMTKMSTLMAGKNPSKLFLQNRNCRV